VMLKARKGEYRLLYLSPERLAREATLGWLKQVPIAFFAIDEAHCISEWGHEFRPEYRQLSSLRHNFPDKPIAAFTASAPRRGRHHLPEKAPPRLPAAPPPPRPPRHPPAAQASRSRTVHRELPPSQPALRGPQ